MKCENCIKNESEVDLKTAIRSLKFDARVCQKCYSETELLVLVPNILRNRALQLNLAYPVDEKTLEQKLATSEAFEKALENKKRQNGSH